MTGRKSTKENFAYLPTTISEVDDFGNVKYSQWNYKILCHPLKRQVPITRCVTVYNAMLTEVWQTD